MVNQNSLENLKKHNFRDIDKGELKELSSKGGIKSAEAKKNKRDLEYLITEKLHKVLFKTNPEGVSNLEQIFERIVNGIIEKDSKTSLNSFKQLVTLLQIIGIGKSYNFSDSECGFKSPFELDLFEF